MVYKGFVRAHKLKYLTVTGDSGSFEVGRRLPSAVFSALRYLVIVPLVGMLWLPLFYNALMKLKGLPPLRSIWGKHPDGVLAGALHDPGLHICLLLMLIVGIAGFAYDTCCAMYNPRISVSRDVIRLASSFPAEQTREIQRGAFDEVQLRDHVVGSRAYSIALFTAPAQWDYLVSVNTRKREVPDELRDIAQRISKLHERPLKSFDFGGKETA